MWYTMKVLPPSEASPADLRRGALATHADEAGAQEYARERSTNGGWVGQHGGPWVFVASKRDSALDAAAVKEETRYRDERERFRNWSTEQHRWASATG